MYTDRTLDALRTMLLASNFAQMNAPDLYRATADTPRSPMPRHNVFVSIDRDGIEVMAPIGPADDYNPADLSVVRLRRDGYTLTPVASQSALRKELDEETVLADPDHINREAQRLAEYASYVEFTLKKNRARKLELLPAVEAGTVEPDLFRTGIATPEAFLRDIEELLTLIPDPSLYNNITTFSTNTMMLSWAFGSGSSRDDPWNIVIKGLERIGQERGWPEDAPA